MTRLPDVNMLIAMAWPNHLHHRAANQWFQGLGTHSWATCPLTQNGFVRISSNPAIIADAVTPQEAAEMLDRYVSHRRHVWVSEDIPLPGEPFASMYVTGHRQVSDAYLLSLCVHKNAKLCTFDPGIPSLLPANSALHRHVEVVIPSSP